MAKYAVAYLTVLVLGFLVALSLVGAPVLVGQGIRGEIRAVPAPAIRFDPGVSNPEFPVNIIITGFHGRAIEGPYSAFWETAGSASGLESLSRDMAGFATYENTEKEPLQFRFEVAWDLTVALYDANDCLVLTAFHPSVDSFPPIEAYGPAGFYRLDFNGSHRQGHASWTIGVDNRHDTASPGDC